MPSIDAIPPTPLSETLTSSVKCVGDRYLVTGHGQPTESFTRSLVRAQPGGKTLIYQDVPGWPARACITPPQGSATTSPATAQKSAWFVPAMGCVAGSERLSEPLWAGRGGWEGKRPPMHTVTLHTPDGLREVACAEDEFILDAAARAGVILPAVCRGGACSVCVARQLGGAEVDQSEQTYLSEGDVRDGWVLLCVASPRGNCAFSTHENEAYLKTLGG